MDSSTISFYDYVTLDATYKSTYMEAFKCDERLEKNISNWMSQGREYPPDERVEAWRGKCKNPLELRFEHLTYKRCLCNFRCSKFGFYLTLYNAFKLGILPYDGAMVDQPSQIIEVFNHIQKLESDRQEFENSKQKK